MATVQSASSTAIASGSTTTTITKPTGLAVGDLMLAQVMTVENDTFSTPSGWTSLHSVLVSGGTTPTRHQVFYKVADSSDTAASNFSFTAAGTNKKGGGIIRVSDISSLIAVAQTNTTASGSASGTLTMSTQTPSRPNSVFVLLAAGGQSGTVSDYTVSTPAIATDNPSWTTQWNLTDAGTSAGNLYCATATRSQTTASGSATLAYSGGSATNNISGIFVLVNSSLASSLAPDVQVISSSIPQIGKGTSITASVGTPVIDLIEMPAQWDNQTKSTTTWTNPNK